ncbi:trans-aconitate 2-methyltransferase [Streptoalloteichus tenebrarius]|uniref:Trans-aconitate 2-methyltransferase n=1 Tax=Streptoalloteichus tenebrarius (strain ATCC 17920 / DSM 40477 / JCM 4838 / CBS 697.72 / NBRC 16177 / NCIMB 11028 / NRRL B-12390 / A12253. 1 / ISP 5477) TaxID=1933 RepID=A0ABT1I3X2_STRSD|nr:trans-aconitate 2-methyltransferase [Streptoalloteichus tenebrarius]MCP2262450.1 trans-aconitate 2-methyltransferase [Streptoalloteichus tenebrarius]BFF00428.1 trans-aconitate 2-methyltransferase [Streptoalloteichus tenebrarius]
MWDPDVYLTFADYRGRPFHDLLARVAAKDPRRVVDLGCGAGNLTRLLNERFPSAVVEAFDSSPEMVAKARTLGVDARVADVRDWTPEPDTDVVITSAVLQWVPQHPELIRRWVAALPSGAWFAMQVPGNFRAPSHNAIVRLADTPEWRAELEGLYLLRTDAVLEPTGYAQLFQESGCEVDAWETTYVHQLSGEDPVLRWVSGTALRPVRARLGEGERWERFLAELAPVLREAYPRQADGSTWVPFRRVFAVAHKR